MGIEINFYKDLSSSRDRLVYERVNKCFFDSETLLNELTYSSELCNKGDEGGLFAPISVKTLNEIIADNSGNLELEMDTEEFIDLNSITKRFNEYDVLMVKVDI